jgi:hypothetical protein
VFDYTDFSELRKVPVMDTILGYDLRLLKQDTTEIIVDNEDTGFSFVQEDDQPFLKRLVHKKDKEQNKYSAIRFWRPPSRWLTSLRTEFYGKYIHSGVYTKGGIGNQKVIWQTHLPYKARYDVYCYIAKIDMSRGPKTKGKTADYNFLVSHDDGVQKVTLNYDELEQGWNLLGSYFISGDTGKVEMTNKSSSDIIYADAVKWVRSSP